MSWLPLTCAVCFILVYGKELFHKHEHKELHLPLHQHYTNVGPQPHDDSLYILKKKGPKQGIATDSNRTSCFINSTILVNGLALLW
jgi:hypothetical protein